MGTPQASSDVLIVHRYPFAGYGLASLIEDQSDLTVTGWLHQGDEVLPSIQRDEPDLVVLDAQLPETSPTSRSIRLVVTPQGHLTTSSP